MQRRQALILLAVLLAAPGVGRANHEDCTCTPASTTINFGAYDVLNGAPLDGAGSFSVNCRLDRSRNSSTRVRYTARLATAPGRSLAPPAGADRLSYQVYVDSARTQPRGDGTGGTFTSDGSVTVPARSSATDSPRNYYGRISPGGQDVSTASPYRQTLTVTVTCRVDD
jgi:spore coat protein U-like protein